MVKNVKLNISEIETKWQKEWEKQGLYQAKDFSSQKKFYLLIEFPYPSGAGLHVGHIRSWAAMDAYGRKRRMQGLNVLYPIGWDAFGLPAENYAIKMGVHPSKIVPKNIVNFKRQCKSLGLSFDWSREIDTTDPKYYKWTQWIFVQLFKNGLAYQAEVMVNWCPFCKTNLADEEVLTNGTHERCGNPTERRPQKQWLLAITKYADRLLDDLKTVDFSPQIALQQINWIGRKEWIDITYPIVGTREKLTVSTTRPDTNFGATFVVVAPEYAQKYLLNLIDKKKQKELREYIKISINKSELERVSEGRAKTGVFTGLYCLNQLNGAKLPIWVTDFVLMNVGTGAVVGVPGHDKRDFEFADKFDLPIIRVVVGNDNKKGPIKTINQVQEEEGIVINSGFLDGLEIHKAIKKMMDYLEDKGWGKRVIRYNLRDWIFSRQHYWGEPIPIIHCPKCGPVSVPEDELPVELPYLEKYEPSGTGESPLVRAKDWLRAKCPKCGGEGKRETDTMPNWAGSNWYFLRYLDSKNDKEIASTKKIKYWMPVDLYQGGFEHTTLHLLYSRFIYKFLFDIGVVPSSEPYAKRRSHGIVLGSDNRKMSKSFGNVINPDEIVNKYGADTLRLYEMFMGPFDQTISWSEESLEGCYRFLNRLWKAFNEKVGKETPEELSIKLHQTIKKVSEDIECLKFNTAVAALMEFLNSWDELGNLSQNDAGMLVKLIAPMMPHLAEEVWVEVLKQKFSVHQQPWPEYNPKLVQEENVAIIVQINGKLRSQLTINNRLSAIKPEVEELAKKDERVVKWLEGKKIKKVIFVPKKLINFVI
jgi:leucyl-tRNA synthetase